MIFAPTIHSKILEHESILTCFHPLVSIKTRSIVGFEALSRGIDPYTEEIIPPDQLFHSTDRDIAQGIDRLCRKKAVEHFTKIPDYKNPFFLSLNFDSSLLNKGSAVSGRLLNLVNEYRLPPNQVVIEILESKVKNLVELENFVAFYKQSGFMIALDDIGAGHSNLDRFALLKPDIVKIDRGLIRNIHQEHYKQEIVKALINLSHNVGAVVVAEGVETEEEILCSMELGADWLQGFYFSKPNPVTLALYTTVTERIQTLSLGFRKQQIYRFHHRQKKRRDYEAMISPLLEPLKECADLHFDSVLQNIVSTNSHIECLYVLDHFGVQISSTVCRFCSMPVNKKFLFRPAPQGADQSLKEYYLWINAGLSMYVSEPYISLATGNMCITISIPFENESGNRHIFCMDINPDPSPGLVPSS